MTLTPEIATALHPYQRKAVAFGVPLDGWLLADQQGLGKTLEILAAITTRADDGLHLIFSPKTALSAVWKPEIARWVPEATIFPLQGTQAQREALLEQAILAAADDDRHVFVLANIEMARIKDKTPKYPMMHATEWDTIVVDESHRALIRTSGKGTQTRNGMMQLRKRAIRAIASSGTPMRGRPSQMWGTLNWLDPKIYSSYWRWVDRYWHVESTRYSDYNIGDWRRNAKALMSADLAPHMTRRTKAEVMPELPPKTYAGSYLDPLDSKSPFGVWLDLTPAQRAQYAHFEREGSLDFDDGGFLVANGGLAEYSRRAMLSTAVCEMRDEKLWPTLDSPKWEWFMEKLDELGIPDDIGDGKIVVASQSTRLIELWQTALDARGTPSFALTGKTPPLRREHMIRRFQLRPDVRVFLMNAKAGGVGVTLDAADDLVIVDETTIPDDQEQIEDRVHRASRIHNVTIHYLRTRGTQDEEVAWVAAAGLRVQRYIMDGSRGIKHARALYHLERDNPKEKNHAKNR